MACSLTNHVRRHILIREMAEKKHFWWYVRYRVCAKTCAVDKRGQGWRDIYRARSTDRRTSGMVLRRQARSLDRKRNVLAGELAVDAREGLELVLEASSILRVQGAADELATVSRDTGALGSNLSRENKVLEDSLMHSSQGAAERAGLLLTRVRARLREDTALTDEHNVVVRELLLEFTSETGQLHNIRTAAGQCGKP